MKKGYIFAAVILALLIALCIMGIVLLNRIFPKAAPIPYPEPDAITTAETCSYLRNNAKNESVSLSKEELPAILAQLSLAKPTRKISVQDTPWVSEYYSVELKTADRMYCYFVYVEDGVTYIEMPYEGIYTTENTFFQTLKTYHSDT